MTQNKLTSLKDTLTRLEVITSRILTPACRILPAACRKTSGTASVKYKCFGKRRNNLRTYLDSKQQRSERLFT